jgi:hypothetical protein
MHEMSDNWPSERLQKGKDYNDPNSATTQHGVSCFQKSQEVLLSFSSSQDARKRKRKRDSQTLREDEIKSPIFVGERCGHAAMKNA